LPDLGGNPVGHPEHSQSVLKVPHSGPEVLVSFLYSSRLEPFVKKFQNRRRGDLASLDLQFSSGVIRILAIYAPNDPCPDLFSSIRTASKVTQLIIAGDLNRVLLPRKSRFVTEELKRKLSMLKNMELSNLVSQLNLVSALHHCSNEPLQPTYFSFCGNYKSQIDHILIKKPLSSALLDCKVLSSPLLSESDHHPVIARFQFSIPQQSNTVKRTPLKVKGAKPKQWEEWTKQGNTLWLSG